jgi:hypothetical protein
LENPKESLALLVAKPLKPPLIPRERGRMDTDAKGQEVEAPPATQTGEPNR